VNHNINYEQVLKSIEIPIAIVCPVLDNGDKILDFWVVFANNAINSISLGRIQSSQNLSKSVPHFYEKFSKETRRLYKKSEESCTFCFNSPVSKMNFIICTKKTKGNFYIIYVHQLIQKKENQYALINSKTDRMREKLFSAIFGKDIELYFQPQFCIEEDCLRGFEALLRWHDNDLGEIAPSTFIPIAEETYLIVRMGWWILEKAICTLKKWQVNYDFKGILSVNISPVQLKASNFYLELSKLIKKYKINPNSLELEITESVLIDDIQQTTEILKKIKEQNVFIALDDFGTGYSSFKYLQCLPVDTLKIDKSLVDDITEVKSVSANIAKTVIMLTKKLGIQTIAEGVESSEQLETLKLMNCDIVQGFFREKPIDQEECEKLLLDQT